jgi:hypothetical protein
VVFWVKAPRSVEDTNVSDVFAASIFRVKCPEDGGRDRENLDLSLWIDSRLKSPAIFAKSFHDFPQTVKEITRLVP